MFKRLKKYITYKFTSYVPGTSKLASMEAKRLSQYIFDNYTDIQRLILLKELKTNIIEMIEDDIKNKEINVIQFKDELEFSKNILIKIQELK